MKMAGIPTRWGVRDLALFVTTVSLAVVLIACGSDSTPPSPGATAPNGDDVADAEGSGGTLRIGMTASNVPIPNTPPDSGGEGRRFVGVQIYDSLVRENTEQADPPEIQPALAESWDVDGDTWTFYLRQDVAFHDGTPWNAEALIFQYRRITDESFEYFDSALSTASSSWLQRIETIELIDDYTVNIITDGEYAFLLNDLLSFLFASPAAVMEHGNDDYVNYASGTGPFKMVRYVDGEVMELEANENYWRGRPKLDRLVLYPMPEAATRLAALQSGDIDWAEAPPPDAIEQLEAAEYQVITGPYPHTNTYFLNMYQEPLDDVRVRQALNYAVDKSGTVALINGVGMEATQYVADGHPWYDPDWDGYSHDPERARELLEEAGYSDGISLRMVYPSGGSGNMFPGPMNEKLQADFATVGIDLELVPTEWLNIQSGRRAGFTDPTWAEYDILHNSWSYTSPSSSFNVFLSYNTPPDGCCNTGGFDSPEYDQLWEEASRTFDIDERNDLMRQAVSLMAQDSAVLFTVHDLNLRVMSPDVHGFVQPFSWTVDLVNVWVE